MDDDAARRRILDEKARVSGLIEQVRGEIVDESDSDLAELSNYDQHPADSGSETFEREKDLSILESLEAELAELEAALARIDAGTYGVDEETGEPIAPERLEAMPIARTNIHPDQGGR